MNRWGRKIFVVLVSVLTLGLYIPPTYVSTSAAEKNEVAPDDHHHEDTFIDDSFTDVLHTAEVDHDPIQQLLDEARDQTITKMGPKIVQKVDEDLTNDILPKIEEIVESILEQADDDELSYYEISEEMTPGYGEKIFNLTNVKTNEEVARFHVRRDKRPGEGYWFNFHYHLKDDQFVTHHTIGEVYWEKNTPPKWMS